MRHHRSRQPRMRRRIEPRELAAFIQLLTALLLAAVEVLRVLHL